MVLNQNPVKSQVRKEYYYIPTIYTLATVLGNLERDSSVEEKAKAIRNGGQYSKQIQLNPRQTKLSAKY